MAESDEDVLQSEDEEDKCLFQNSQTDLQSLSSPKTGTGFLSVRLQKNYYNLSPNLSNTEGIIDSLISKGVLDPDDRSEIVSSRVQAKINRKLIDQIRRAILPSFTNTPGFQTMVTLVSIVKAVQISNTEPESHETSLSADLYRLQSWYKKILKMIVMDSHQYQQFVQTVKRSKLFSEILVRLGEDDDPVDITWNTGMKKQVKKVLYGLKEKKEHSGLKEKIIKMEMEQDEVIPKNIRDQIEKEIKDWEKKDESFVTTRASEYVIECLQDNSCLTLTAPSGVGKSFIARHTSLVLQKEGYKIIPVRKPDDIRDYYQTGKKTVFIVDDICGNFTANQQQVESWQQLLPVINTIIADKCCKIIVSCREKQRDVKEFFKNPFIVYQNELDSLNRCGVEGNYKICSLALLVLFNNQLKEKWFKGKVTNEQRHIIEDTCEACRLNRSTSKAELKWALFTLDGTFVYKQNGIYKTVHDKLFDFLAHYFGQKMIECLIDHGDSDLVHERFIWRQSPDDKNSKIDFIIEVPDDYLEAYLERFIKDWSAGKVEVVFCNNNLGEPLFIQQLLQHSKQLDKSQQVTLANTKDIVLSKEYHGSGTTPLIQTCFDGYTDMVQWMLHNDVDVDQCRDDAVTGLNMASQEGYTDVVKMLLERNPNVNLCGNNGLRLLLEKNPNVDLCDNDGCSPLYMANQNEYTDVVKLLLERKSNVDICGNNGCNPLYKASQIGKTDIVRLLLEKNPNVDICDNDGCSPLNMASQNGYTDVVKLLLERNPNVDICGNNGCSPLYKASQIGKTDIVRLLLEKNPNVDLCDNDGCSPLNMSSQNGYTDVVKLLLERNPNVDICGNNGCSSLYKGKSKLDKLI
ncbi:unnamed protein product [Mytilus coruscus]|uniref:CARD domain-containing protein n=1 Tax=Mytilus coruscus TaxID=42192 RepID=A0A6J8A2I4_MYTCO|nr:unnamed protein product [Mytilus coruscus]